MPVIINEFELITEQQPPSAPPRSPQGQGQSEQQKTLRPADILRIQEWQQQRLKRILAD